MNEVAIGLALALGGLLCGYGIRALLGRRQADSVEKQAAARLEAAGREAAARLKEADIQARAEVVRAREEFEISVRARRKEQQEQDERLARREENIERKLKAVETREQDADERQTRLGQEADELAARREELGRLLAEAQTRLQRLAGMTQEEARRELRRKVEDDVRAETGGLLRRLQEEARETAEREARELVALAVQRHAAPHAGESMTSTVALPNDELKGRIIGREGRNIRAFEAAAGVTVLIDDTPEAVVVSAFDPVRREVARQALEVLVADGRIHPARIEEAVAKAQAEMEKTILRAGEEAAYEVRQQHVDPELLRLLGRLRYRTSFSQNVLEHSLEVARLMGVMAGELGLDPDVARRVGLFHDIGKSADHEADGSHALIGAEILRKAREAPLVVNAVAAHHEEAEASSLYAVLCSAADAISSSRPGARAESTGVYVQRLEKLEAIATACKGVRGAYAIQAGRELRVIVDPDVLGDNEAMLLAREIGRRIEAELRYPGQIRVVVVREKRCIEYAR
jgi:ribonuclease Y